MMSSPEERFLQEFEHAIAEAKVATDWAKTIKHWAKLLKLREDAVPLDEAEKHLANLRDNRDCVTCYSNYCKFRDRVATLKELTTPNNTSNTLEDEEG